MELDYQGLRYRFVGVNQVRTVSSRHRRNLHMSAFVALPPASPGPARRSLLGGRGGTGAVENAKAVHSKLLLTSRARQAEIMVMVSITRYANGRSRSMSLLKHVHSYSSTGVYLYSGFRGSVRHDG